MDEELLDVAVNSLVWVSSLHETEQGVTRRILEDLGPFLDDLGIGLNVYYPRTTDEFYLTLDHIWQATRGTFRPIIHIDMHGNPDSGLRVVDSGEDIPWNNVLEIFRQINVNMNNTLCVVSLACFGFHMLAQGELVMNRPAPCFALVASENEIVAGDIEARVAPFYRELFEVQDLGQTCDSVWGGILRVWRAETFMFETLLNYVLHYARGKGLSERVDRLLTEARRQGIVTPRNLPHLRRLAKRGLKPGPNLVVRARRDFYMGRPIGFTFEQLMQAADKMERVLQRTRRRQVIRPLARFKKH